MRVRPGSLPFAITATLVASLALGGCREPGEDHHGAPPAEAAPLLYLTVLHGHDGESRLLADDGGTPEDASDDTAGISRFVSLVRELRRQGSLPRGDGNDAAAILLSSGDGILAGKERNAGARDGVDYDALAVNLIGYDALCLGNHDFDFGPEALARFVEDVDPFVPFLSANLDFSGEPELAALARTDPPRLAGRAVIRVDAGSATREIGVVGATTESLRTASSPGGVGIRDVAASVQAEIDALAAAGVKIVIVISHGMSVDEDLALAPLLRGADVVIAGGGGPDPELPYPLTAGSADGRSVPVVTAPGGYRYCGRLVAAFDADGDLVEIDRSTDPLVPERGPISGPVRVAGVRPDPVAEQAIVEPVRADIAMLAARRIAVTEVDLDGRRGRAGSRGLRTAETNLGGLVADALKWQADREKSLFGVSGDVHFAVLAGGEFPSDRVIPVGPFDPGPVTELDTFDIVSSSRVVAVVEGLTPADVKRILERAAAGVESADGPFLQVSKGLSFEIDLAGTAQVADSGTGRVTTPGTRVSNVRVGGEQIVDSDGVVRTGSGPFNVATSDLLARQWGGRSITLLGTSCRRALYDFLTAPEIEGGLGGFVGESDYPWEGQGEGRNRVDVYLAGAPGIYDLQGRGHVSPVDGHVARDVEGVVLAVEKAGDSSDDDGFFLQAEAGDGDDDTSDAIFVLSGRAPERLYPRYDAGPAAGEGVEVGDRVRVTGRVVERYLGGFGNGGLSGTILAKPRIERLARGMPLPTPVVVGQGGRVPPNRVIDDDGLTEFNPNGPGVTGQDAIDFFEALEGMRVRLEAPVTCVSGNAKYGEIAVLADGGASVRADAVFSTFGGVVLQEGVYAPDILIIEDYLYSRDPQAKTGDRLTGSGGGPIDGVMWYTFHHPKFLNTGRLEAIDGGATEEMTDLLSSASEVTIATWNLKNLSPIDYSNRFDDIAAAIVANLGAPDIVAVQEVQDENGVEPGTPEGDGTFEELIDELNDAAGSPGDYRYVQIDPLNNADGGAPGGNIRVGFLYRDTRVALADPVLGVGDAVTETEVWSGPVLSVNPGRIAPLHPSMADGRKPLVAHFTVRNDGSDLFLVNVHLKSKSGDDPLFGTRQPPRAPSASRRHEQAKLVDAFVRDLLFADVNAKVVVLGDLNDYPFSETAAILGANLTQLVESAGSTPDDGYTFLFNGTMQALDNVFVSGAIAGNTEYDVVHFAQDFGSAVQRYLSDHDPIVIRVAGFLGIPTP